MNKCSKCGNEFEWQYCPKCGTKAVGGNPETYAKQVQDTLLALLEESNKPGEAPERKNFGIVRKRTDKSGE